MREAEDEVPKVSRTTCCRVSMVGNRRGYIEGILFPVSMGFGLGSVVGSPTKSGAKPLLKMNLAHLGITEHLWWKDNPVFSCVIL